MCQTQNISCTYKLKTNICKAIYIYFVSVALINPIKPFPTVTKGSSQLAVAEINCKYKTEKTNKKKLLKKKKQTKSNNNSHLIEVCAMHT